MTGTAIQRGRDVGGIGLRIHTNRGTTIMTRNTVVHDAGMIKHTGGKTGNAVAHTAIFCGGYVSGRLTYGEGTVVAGRTIAGYTRVIEDRRKKRCG